MAREETALVERVAEGDRGEPLATLYDRYASSLYGLGRRVLGDEGMAEELVQETFLRLWRNAERYDPAQATPRTFVFMLARRVAVDLHRRVAARPQSGGGPAEQAALEAASVDDASFERVALELDMRGALDALSHKHREVLELHFHRDLRQRDIATHLGVPLGTVKTRTFHALRALRLELEERDLID